MSNRHLNYNMTHTTNVTLHNHRIETKNIKSQVSRQSSDMNTPLNGPESNSGPRDGTHDIKRIVVTFKSLRFEMFHRKDGKWVIVSPAKRRANYSRRRVGNERSYAEALRRKKLRESTAFGRYRRDRMREMHSHRYKNLDLQKVRQLYKTQKSKD